jgi:hypothetical protein
MSHSYPQHLCKALHGGRDSAADLPGCLLLCVSGPGADARFIKTGDDDVTYWDQIAPSLFDY